jgi:hypothetical protein
MLLPSLTLSSSSIDVFSRVFENRRLYRSLLAEGCRFHLLGRDVRYLAYRKTFSTMIPYSSEREFVFIIMATKPDGVFSLGCEVRSRQGLLLTAEGFPEPGWSLVDEGLASFQTCGKCVWRRAEFARKGLSKRCVLYLRLQQCPSDGREMSSLRCTGVDSGKFHAVVSDAESYSFLSVDDVEPLFSTGC